MKQLWSKIILVFFIFIGISFLLFVLRMAWFPPGTLGMMMGPKMIIHHVIYMFNGVFFFSIILLGVGGTVWHFTKKRN